ncbi:MAG TPA: helix-turn-helix transcriptional regulator [Rummeliibacillus sp.]|nr:helix-turn-helix transcriptional regulator [Rummeliibacillus sp.]
MKTSKKIKLLLTQHDMTITQLAKMLNISQPALSQKLKKDDFTESELESIAKAFNGEYIAYFQFKDGSRL